MKKLSCTNNGSQPRCFISMQWGNDASNANDSSKVIVETKAGNITQGDLYKQMKDTIGQDQFNTLVRSVTEEKVLSKNIK